MLLSLGVAQAQAPYSLYYGQDQHPLRSIAYSRPPLLHLEDFLAGIGLSAERVEDRLVVEVNRRRLEINTVRETARYSRKEVAFPMRIKDNQVYVRVGALVDIFSYLLGREVIFDSTSKTVYVPDTKDLVVRIRSRRIEQHYRLIIDYSYGVDRPLIQRRRDKLIVKVKTPRLIVDRSGFEAGEAVSALQIFQNLPDNSSEIVFTLTDNTLDVNSERYNPNNPRSLIKLSGDYASLETDQNQEQEQLGIRRIVLDPGHGGRDMGAVGPTGLEEKDVTLEIALMLQERLQEDYEVLLTRRDDTHLSLKARTGFANNQKADLFISIHVNAIPSQNATGSETYYLSLEDDTDVDLSHYNDEEGVSGPDPGLEDDLTLMLWDMAHTKHIEDSFLVATYIQESLNVLSGIKSRGVKQLPLKVLRGATMPAVLLEVAFISNSYEEKKLKTVAFREKAADAVAAAVRRYDEDVRRRNSGKDEDLLMDEDPLQ